MVHSDAPVSNENVGHVEVVQDFLEVGSLAVWHEATMLVNDHISHLVELPELRPVLQSAEIERSGPCQECLKPRAAHPADVGEPERRVGFCLDRQFCQERFDKPAHAHENHVRAIAQPKTEVRQAGAPLDGGEGSTDVVLIPIDLPPIGRQLVIVDCCHCFSLVHLTFELTGARQGVRVQ